METMSLAIPIATKVKKIASRKNTTALLGVVRKGLVGFMKSETSSQIIQGHPEARFGLFRGFPIKSTLFGGQLAVKSFEFGEWRSERNMRLVL